MCKFMVLGSVVEEKGRGGACIRATGINREEGLGLAVGQKWAIRVQAEPHVQSKTYGLRTGLA